MTLFCLLVCFKGSFASVCLKSIYSPTKPSTGKKDTILLVFKKKKKTSVFLGLFKKKRFFFQFFPGFFFPRRFVLGLDPFPRRLRPLWRFGPRRTWPPSSGSMAWRVARFLGVGGGKRRFAGCFFSGVFQGEKRK